MSQFKIIVSPDASNDIDGICAYISLILQNPAASNTLLNELLETFLSLTSLPKRIRPLEN